MKIAIIDKLGLCYDGDTLQKQGLGGSESAVIYISKELSKIGFDVTVYNNCKDGSHSKEGVFDSVKYIDNSNAKKDDTVYDIVIVSRTVKPFVSQDWPFIHKAKKRILWLHDTFIDGDQIMEQLVVSGKIDHIFTLSDWHTTYILNSTHGPKRNFEVLKKKVFQTRNGACCHIPEIDLSKKDPNHFVYNSSATKGMIPLLEDIWPEIKKRLPQAKLTIIGGYYRFREGAKPDEQENTVSKLAQRQDLKDLGVTFTGVIPQHEISEILANAWMMLYPCAFPETFGISALESLLYKTPLVTTRFGALEETAIDMACYHIDYAIEPNSLFPHIDKGQQVQNFIELFFKAYNTPYLHQQKQNYCDVVKDVAGWDTVALQWKQFFFSIMGDFLSVDEYQKVTRINDKVSRIFGRTNSMPVQKEYRSYGSQRRIVVISPFWNAESYVTKNIKSVAAQDYENYVHVLINDNSDDDSKSIAENVIKEMDTQKHILGDNKTNMGAIFNQLSAVKEHVDDDDIVIFLDGDDWLVNNNTIFHYYNDLYDQGYEFTYGSMWSVVDNIPLIAQEYPSSIKESKSYRQHHFNWKIPYTHLRTVLGKHVKDLDLSKFKDEKGVWMKSGADNPLFYELIEKVEPEKIFCNREIVCNYNDANPLNDYKIRGDEQNRNASKSYKGEQVKKILVAIPTAKYIEVETFKSLWDLEVPKGYELDFRYSFGYTISQIRNLIAEWAKDYDYLLSVDSDIVMPKDALIKMIAADKDIISGLYIQRIPNTHTLEVYMDTPNGGCTNIPYDLIRDRGVVEIAACGMGCALIKSEVFRKLPYPHFFYKEALTIRDTVSEDVYFCMKARQHGFVVWADSTIICDHKGSMFFRVHQEQKTHLQKVAEQDLLPKEHTEYLKNMNIQPKVIYDIGACVQHWTRKAKDVWPDAKYYLIDAADSVKPFIENEEHAIALLSNVNGKVVDFYENESNPGGNSYYIETTGAFDQSHKKKRITATLNTLIEENEWKIPELIKMDVQGAELDILKGADRVLENCKDIILEAQHVNYNEGAPKFEEVKSYLESIGYTLKSIITKNSVDGDYHFTKI
jgi:FkbM family methyltransferase